MYVWTWLMRRDFLRPAWMGQPPHASTGAFFPSLTQTLSCITLQNSYLLLLGQRMKYMNTQKDKEITNIHTQKGLRMKHDDKQKTKISYVHTKIT